MGGIVGIRTGGSPALSGLVGRRIRQLRGRLGLSQAAFAARYGIPVVNIRQYDIGRTMPPPAVQSLLKVIAAELESTAA